MSKSISDYENFRLRLAEWYRVAVRFNLLESKCMPYGYTMKVGEIFEYLSTNIHSYDEYKNFPFPDRWLDGTINTLTAWIVRNFQTLVQNDRYYTIHGANLGLWTIEETLNYIEDAKVHHMEVIVSNGELLYHEKCDTRVMNDFKILV